MLRNRIAQILRERYPGRNFRYGEPPDPVATLDNSHPSIGTLEIYDDGDEATIGITEVTHGHFNPYDEEMEEVAREQWILDEVIDFLDALFDDRVVFYRSHDRRIGGWMVSDTKITEADGEKNAENFTWSGPLQNTSEQAGA